MAFQSETTQHAAPPETIQRAAPRVLAGPAFADGIKAEAAAGVAAAKAAGYTPGLAVILVGHVPASELYVRSKVKTCAELGIVSELYTPDESVTTDELLALVASLNARADIDGILIQLPLPPHVDTARLLEAVDPAKDVDGFHPVNSGRLLAGHGHYLAPCTPAGVMEMLALAGIDVAGKRAVVLGKSNIVGKPMAALLLNAYATVTVGHRRTRDVAAITREAELLVVAIGVPGFITPDMVRPGAVLVDVGINRVTDRSEVERFFPAGHPEHDARMALFAKRGSVVIGDIHPATFATSSAYTPVPGGVGTLTIAMLMANTVRAARMRRGLQPAAMERD